MNQRPLFPDLPNPRPLYMQTITSYLIDVMLKPSTVIDQAREVLHTNKVQADTLVGRGLSGTIAVTVLGPALGMHWAVARKREHTHSQFVLEGRLGSRWLFVDDLICSGSTLRDTIRIVEQACIRAEYPVITFVGALLYNNQVSYRPASSLDADYAELYPAPALSDYVERGTNASRMVNELAAAVAAAPRLQTFDNTLATCQSEVGSITR